MLFLVWGILGFTMDMPIGRLLSSPFSWLNATKSELNATEAFSIRRDWDSGKMWKEVELVDPIVCSIANAISSNGPMVG